MVAVILAAGMGSRLAPLTENIPKCLVPLGPQTSLVDVTLRHLRSAQMKDVLVVTGYRENALRHHLEGWSQQMKLRYIFNPKFTELNNYYSLFLALDALGDNEFLLINSDTLFHEEILTRLLSQPKGHSYLVVDTSKPLTPEAMKVQVSAGRLTAIGKDLALNEAYGEYIGIARFAREDSRQLRETLRAMYQEGCKNEWYEHAFGRLFPDVSWRILDSDGLPWCEVDDHADLALAKQLFQNYVR